MDTNEYWMGDVNCGCDVDVKLTSEDLRFSRERGLDSRVCRSGRF